MACTQYHHRDHGQVSWHSPERDWGWSRSSRRPTGQHGDAGAQPIPIQPRSRLATNVAALLAHAPSHTVEGSRFKALYAEFTGEHLDLKGHGKLADLLARCEAAGVCWLEFRQENPRHPPVLFVHAAHDTAEHDTAESDTAEHDSSSSSVRGASAGRRGAEGLSSPIFDHPQRGPAARVASPTREWCVLSGWVEVTTAPITPLPLAGLALPEPEATCLEASLSREARPAREWCCLSGWVEVTTAGLAPPEPEATCLAASLSREDAPESARQIEEDEEAFARELQTSPSQGRAISLPSATSCLSPTSGRCGGGESTASCDECAICMDHPRCLDICLWPCRHRHFCRDCADTLVYQPCPICRCLVTEVLPLY